MSQPNVSVSAPVSFPHRAFDWWLVQMRHVLPPTIFFFIGFNLILWTKRLILEEHGIDASPAVNRMAIRRPLTSASASGQQPASAPPFSTRC